MADLLGVEANDVMIVGHYPFLPGLLQMLAGDPAVFPQNGTVALERTTEGWVEQWRELAPTT